MSREVLSNSNFPQYLFKPTCYTVLSITKAKKHFSKVYFILVIKTKIVIILSLSVN